jgi:hypothetical protein
MIHWRSSCSLALLVFSVGMILPHPPEPAQSQTSVRRNSWDYVWQQIIRRQDQDPPRTSRGSICPVVPQLINRRVIWRDRPIFVWKGKVSTVSVYKFADSQQPIWTTDRLGSNNTVVYAGEPLQPGTRYIWKGETRSAVSQVIFQTLAQAERDRVTAQLTQLEMQLQQQKATPEAKLQQRVQFFLEQNLVLDAIQELYTVSPPSAALKELQQKIMSKSCPS